MHEMGICTSILETSIDAARDAGATKIKEVHITIGDLTEIQEFALQFAWEALTPGTMAEGGTLICKHLEPRSECLDCGHTYTHDRFELMCPECGALNVKLLQGRELTIDSIETEDGEALTDDETDDASASAADAAPEE